jgi:hypothetical protein
MTTALRPDNRVNKTLGITIELKITSQVVYLNQQVLSFLAYGGSSLMKTANNSSFDMRRVVSIEVKISASVGRFFVDTLRTSLVRTRPKRDPQQTAHCVYSIPCECGRCYIGKTGRPLAVQIREHRHNLKEGLLDKSKLAQHAYEEGHRVGWDEATILEIESNSRYGKYKESAHMACVTNPISQPSLDISPLWIPLISKEVSKSKGKFV